MPATSGIATELVEADPRWLLTAAETGSATTVFFDWDARVERTAFFASVAGFVPSGAAALPVVFLGLCFEVLLDCISTILARSKHLFHHLFRLP